MNRIEDRLNKLKSDNKKAFITYITAGLPNIEKTKELIKAQEAAGIDVIELGVPFSDPIADGPVIQQASYEAICGGVNINTIFDAVEELRSEGVKVPIVFMLYYNTINHYGLKEFTDRCISAGVDGLLIPDLPYEEQGDMKHVLDGKENAPILMQLVSPVSEERIDMIAKDAKGFIYCVSSMGVTGQAAAFHKKVREYLEHVKRVAKVPVMMGFGIRTADDVAPLKDTIDGAIVGSYFINLLRENNFDANVAAEYVSTFKKELNS